MKCCLTRRNFSFRAQNNFYIIVYICTWSHCRYLKQPKTTNGGKQTTENGKHFKAFCGKHGRAALENSWLMQVPRYRTAYTPFAALLLWSIWICHCVKLSLPGPLPPSFPLALVTSLYLSLSLFLRPSFSRIRNSIRSSKFLSVHLSVYPPLHTPISSPQICDAPRRRAKVH